MSESNRDVQTSLLNESDDLALSSETDSEEKKKQRKKEILRMVKFLLFSISAGVIQIVTFTLLDWLTGWDYWLKYLIALVLSVLWNFTFNRRFTFQSANNVPVAMLKVLAYYLVFTPLSLLLGQYLAGTNDMKSEFISHVVRTYLGEPLGWNEYLVTFLLMLLNFVTEFLYSRFVTFRHSIDTNELAQKEKTETVEDHQETTP